MNNEMMLEQLYELKVASVVLTEEKTGMEMYSASLETHSIAQTVGEELIKAGTENETFVRLTKDKEIKVELTDIQQKRDWIAAKMGGTLTEQLVEVSAFPKNYKVQSELDDVFVELEQEPKNGVMPKLYNKKTNKAIEASNLSLEGKRIVIENEAFVEGDVIFGSSYRYETVAEALKIDNSATTPNFRVELHIPVLHADMSLAYTKKVIFHRASLGQDWTFDGSTDITKQTTSHTLTVLKHDDYEELGYVVYEKPVK